jgi:DNA-directed RNA polymerase subunit RPC12/RpoP
MRCYECGWSRISRTREGGFACPRCGTRAVASQRTESAEEQPSLVVKIYTLTFAVIGLGLPFLIPIILKLSQRYPMELGTPW